VPALIGFGMRATSDLALPLFVLVAVTGCLVGVVMLRRRTQRVESRE
jgi:hypothetical protein